MSTRFDNADKMLNERRDEARVLDVALNAIPQRFEHVDVRHSAAYLILYCGDLELLAPVRRPHGRVSLGSIADDGGFPIYAGSALQIRERFGRHICSLAPVRSLPVDDLLAVPLVTGSWDGATYAERILIRVFDPLLNKSFLAGFGSRGQGEGREKVQRIAPFNVLFPGRPGCHVPAKVSAKELATKAAVHLRGVSDLYRTALHDVAADDLAPVTPLSSRRRPRARRQH
jgi:hypothetical protein